MFLSKLVRHRRRHKQKVIGLPKPTFVGTHSTMANFNLIVEISRGFFSLFEISSRWRCSALHNQWRAETKIFF